MSRMTTSLASFSWARPAMRRACSSGVSRSDLRVGLNVLSLAAVEAAAGDFGCHRRRHEPVDRLPAGDPLPDLARGDGNRLDLEEEDALGLRQPGEYALERLAGIAGTA